MNVLTDREIHYNAKGKDEKKGLFKNFGEKVKNLKQNQLFQTGAAAYGGYLQQKYQGGGFQPLETADSNPTSNKGPQVTVTGDEPKKGMSTGTKIGIGIGVAAIIGIVIFVATKKNKAKK